MRVEFAAGPSPGGQSCARSSDDAPVSRQLAGRVARVEGLAWLEEKELRPRGGRRPVVSPAGKGASSQQREPLDIRYVNTDVTSEDALSGERFDAVTASFAVTDIDDLDGLAATVARVLAPGGPFVLSMLHPCFAGGGEVSPSWPSAGSYYDEGWWRSPPDDRLSILRQQVGANHPKLSTYLNTLISAGLRLETIVEPPPPNDWVERRTEASRGPVFLVARFVRE